MLAFALLFIITLTPAHPGQGLTLVAPFLPDNMEEKGTKGREAEILQLIFKCMELEVSIDLQPFVRHIRSFSNNHFDGVLTVPSYVETSGFDTKNYVNYYNGAIVRQEDFPKGVDKVEDLAGKDVITFVDGKDLLNGIQGKTSIFSSYVETSDQKTHVEMLLKNRVHAVFGDGLIFTAFYKRLLKEKPEYKNIPIRFYGVFKATSFKASFKKESHRDKFNSCLERLSKDGSLNAVEKSYVNPNSHLLGPDYLEALIRK